MRDLEQFVKCFQKIRVNLNYDLFKLKKECMRNFK